MKKFTFFNHSIPSWVFYACGLSLTLAISVACSSSDSTPTSGSSLQKTEGRLLIASETGSSVGVIDLEQSILESSSKSYSNSTTLVASPEGNFAFVVQPSGNRIDLLKMGTSTAVSASSSDSSSEEDDHGHSHGKPRLTGSDESSTTTTTSVDTVGYSITGQNPNHIVAKGQWISFQFEDKVYVMSEESLENNLNSITEEPIITKTSSLPGVPLDEEHLALGGNVVEIELSAPTDSAHVAGNAIAAALTSDNIHSATRATEGVGLFGTDQGVLLVCLHTESGNATWEDFMVPYPTVAEANIFLAEHAHEGEEEEEEGEDEHDEVIENIIATEWATHDGIGHAFAHFTHEEHSAGIHLIEASTLEEDEVSGAWEFLDGTSSSSSRPVAINIAKVSEEEHHDEEEEEEEEEHQDEYRLLILMSSGNLRVHDAVNEGALVTVLENVISPISDFHEGEGNLPGLASGLGKVYVGDPSNNQVHQIDLSSLSVELTWTSDMQPNQLLFLGESTLAEGEGDDHDHD